MLRAAAETIDPSPLRGLLHLGASAEEIGDAAQQMVWLIEEGEELHPVLPAALGETDDVVVRMPVAAGSALDGAVLSTSQLGDDTGFHLLALRRAGRYVYRPRAGVRIEAGDDLLAHGPWEGRDDLAEQCGYRLVDDDDTGTFELEPLGAEQLVVQRAVVECEVTNWPVFTRNCQAGCAVGIVAASDNDGADRAADDDCDRHRDADATVRGAEAGMQHHRAEDQAGDEPADVRADTDVGVEERRAPG